MNDMQNPDKRLFPRMRVQCPVLYLAAGSRRRQVAILLDLSATGLMMKTREALTPETKLEVELKPGSHREVPPLAGDAEVVRCDGTPEDGYKVSCKLTRIARSFS